MYCEPAMLLPGASLSASAASPKAYLQPCVSGVATNPVRWGLPPAVCERYLSSALFDGIG